MNEREALKLALEALQWNWGGEPLPTLELQAINAIKEVLAQPEQKAVPWATRENYYRELNRSVEHIRKEMEIKSVIMRCKDYDLALPIINTHFGRVLVGQVFAPPQREWVGLTEEERDHFEGLHLYAARNQVEAWIEGVPAFIDAIEAKLREKNGG